jgi:hypothetical protein
LKKNSNVITAELYCEPLTVGYHRNFGTVGAGPNTLIRNIPLVVYLDFIEEIHQILLFSINGGSNEIALHNFINLQIKV